MDFVVGSLVLGTLASIAAARRRARAERILVAVWPEARRRPVEPHPVALSWWERQWQWVAGLAASAGGTVLGIRLLGPLGLMFAMTGLAVPFGLDRRRRRKEQESMERQLGDLAATIALGVRSGLSIPQSLDLAAEEAEPPLSPLLERMLAERRIGADLGSSLTTLAEGIGTDDARLLVLILLTHARTGGNLAAALQEVAVTIRHRVEARRELRALTAQGRISGAILGALPIGFFVVLAATSGNELASVYRSGPGIAMVVAGLALEVVAYLWIRHLLRIEA
ncbi:MAG: type II secretion system F family protein [Actinomycetota bacterium]